MGHSNVSGVATKMDVNRQAPVVLCVNDLGFLLSHRREIALALKHKGRQVVVVGPVEANACRILQEMGLGFENWSVTRRGKNPLREAQTVLQLAYIYNRLKPSVVHHVAQKAVLYGSIAAEIVGLSHRINAIAGFGYAKSKSSGFTGLVVRLLHRFVHRGADIIIVQNRSDYHIIQDWSKVSCKKIHLIPGSGVDPLQFFPAARLPQDCRILFWLDF